MTTFPHDPPPGSTPSPGPVKTAEYVELHAGAIRPDGPRDRRGRASSRVTSSRRKIPTSAGRFLLESRGDGKGLRRLPRRPGHRLFRATAFQWSRGCKHASALLDLVADGRAVTPSTTGRRPPSQEDTTMQPVYRAASRPNATGKTFSTAPGSPPVRPEGRGPLPESATGVYPRPWRASRRTWRHSARRRVDRS